MLSGRSSSLASFQAIPMQFASADIYTPVTIAEIWDF